MDTPSPRDAGSPFLQQMEYDEVSPGGRVFLYASGKKSAHSSGGKTYMLMIRDDFMHSRDEVSKFFSQYFAGYRLMVCHLL